MDLDPEAVWFLVGLVLMVLELAAPGAVLVFFGAAAWIVALMTYLGFTVSLISQLILFPSVSAALLLSLRKLTKQKLLQ